MCFVTWSSAVAILGAVKTSVYIYLLPVVTVATSAVVLREPVTTMTVAGTALTLLGLALSEGAQGVTECTGPPGGIRELPPSRAAWGPLPPRVGEERALEFLS